MEDGVAEHFWVRLAATGGVPVKDRHAWAVQASHRHPAAKDGVLAVECPVCDEVHDADDSRDVAHNLFFAPRV
jgi:hypothetical protein